MPDPKNEDPTEDSTESSAGEVAETGPADTAESADTADEAPSSDTPDGESSAADVVTAEAGGAEPEVREPSTSEKTEEATDPDPAEAKTVAMPVVRKAEPATADLSEAPTTQIPVTSHTPKAEPQRIAPRVPEPPRSEPAPFQPSPAPTRIPPSPRKGRAGWMVLAGAGAAVVIIAIAVVAVLQYRESNSPEAHIRTSIDEFVQALSSGDLATLQTSTCGGLAEFYATVDPEEFDNIHELAVEQGSVPVVSSIDKVQITDNTAIAEVTAHTTGNPSDVTARTFDLALQGEEWKVCGE